MEQQKDNEVIGLKSIIIDYISHWRLFLATFIFAIVLGVLYVLLYPRTYEIMARVQLQDEKGESGIAGLGEAAGLMKSFGIGSIGDATINVDDELSIIASSALMRRVAFDLGINVNYTAPYSFYRMYDKTPYQLTTDSITDKRLLDEVRFKVRLKDGAVKINTKSRMSGKHTFSYPSLPAVIALPEGNFTLDRPKGKEQLPLIDIDILYKPSTWTAEEMSDDFLIETYSKSSNIIEISSTDYERNRAINTFNLLIDYYNEQAQSYTLDLNSRTLSYLDLRIDSVTDALKTVEYDIAEFKNINSLTDIEHDVQYYVEQMRDIQTKVIELETQSHIVRLMSDFVTNPSNKYNPMPNLMSYEGDKSSPILTYNQALIERARIIQNSSENNPLVSDLTMQADKLRESVFLSIENLQKATGQAISDMKGKEKTIYETMKRYPSRERDYYEMKRQQEIFQGVYLILLQKREEIALNNGLNREKGKIIDAAFVKKKPVAPRKIYAAIGILVFTIIVPVVWLFCRQQAVSIVNEYKRRNIN